LALLRTARFVRSLLFAVVGSVSLAGCGARTGLFSDDRGPGPAPTGSTAIPETPQQARADKIDLLFVVDDSGSMGDKQAILSRAVPDMVSRLINPLCVEPESLTPVTPQPASAVAPCPAGSLREFNAVQDVHIGVVSTSLGGLGAPLCGAGAGASSQNGRGRLVPPRSRAGTERTFLSWDPGQVGSPPGEKDADRLRTDLRGLIDLGEGGCQYEMPLEAAYRFLVDPEPYSEVRLATCATASGAEDCAVQEGTDDVLLGQRSSFLRYDSLVAIVFLTDENDCSLVAGGKSFKVFDSVGNVPRASSACAKDPSDPCCRSCAAPAHSGCAILDPECSRGPYTSETDSGLLRCFDQKRRLGVDYLYPTSRYVDGLTGKPVPRRNGALAENPLFHDPSGKLPPRDPSLVFVAGVVGVPWQDIAVAPFDTTALEFKTADQMANDGTWELILGDPARGLPPGDPLMIESTAERTGVQPILGVPLASSNAASPLENPINGHESALGTAPMELQYACIFDLPQPEASYDCSQFSGQKRAICQAPDGRYDGLQYRAKAYPGRRELEVLKGVGKNAIVASICSRNLRTDTSSDFGYRPVLQQVLDRLRFGLN
jgi:hypothetical protein